MVPFTVNHPAYYNTSNIIEKSIHITRPTVWLDVSYSWMFSIRFQWSTLKFPNLFSYQFEYAQFFRLYKQHNSSKEIQITYSSLKLITSNPLLNPYLSQRCTTRNIKHLFHSIQTSITQTDFICSLLYVHSLFFINLHTTSLKQEISWEEGYFCTEIGRSKMVLLILSWILLELVSNILLRKLNGIEKYYFILKRYIVFNNIFQKVTETPFNFKMRKGKSSEFLYNFYFPKRYEWI